MLKKKSYLFLETSLALSSSLLRVVTSSLRSSKLSRSCRKGILYQFYNTSHFLLYVLWWDRAGSLSAIYNIHLGRHPDIPKLFRPPLSQPLPHILCLLLTLHCHCIPKVLCVSLCAAKNASLHSCFFPNTHLLVSSTS